MMRVTTLPEPITTLRQPLGGIFDPAEDLPRPGDPALFTPTMPYPVTLPWPTPWDEVRVVFCQYLCEQWLDAEEGGSAEIRRTARALDQRRTTQQARAEAVQARSAALAQRAATFDTQKATLTPAQREAIAAQLAAEAAAWEAERPQALAALQDSEETWTRDWRAWRKTKALAELRYYVLKVVWPDGTETPGAAPATWAAFPLRLLEWLTTEGYTQAREALWAAPKAPAPPTDPAPAG